MQLIRALALRLQVNRASPLTTLHIEGDQNAMTDIPLHSFGGVQKWYCAHDTDFLAMYNSLFPLPNQELWNLFHLSSRIGTKIISILQTKVINVDVWRRLPRTNKLVGPIGKSLSNLWGWTLTYRGSTTPCAPASSLDSQLGYVQGSLAEDARSQLKRSLQHSRPLARRSPWPWAKTQPSSRDLTNSSHTSPKC
jgi:hypothetical protein